MYGRARVGHCIQQSGLRLSVERGEALPTVALSYSKTWLGHAPSSSPATPHRSDGRGFGQVGSAGPGAYVGSFALLTEEDEQLYRPTVGAAKSVRKVGVELGDLPGRKN